MIVLALDTALEACSVALGRGERLLAHRYAECGKAHAEILMPMIEAVLGDSQLDVSAIERIGVTVGPGSFTGLRTGLAAARGLALALGRPAVGVTTCAVLAAGAPQGEPIAAAIEARRGEIYFAAFDGKGGEALSARALALGEGVKLLSERGGTWRIVGSGSQALAHALAAAGVDAEVIANVVWPDAANMLGLITHAVPEESPPRPLYLRAVDAKRMGEVVP
jgi:tRNA threonylcarbamoyladenosine biosynthesis protein TsaB